MGRTLGFLCYLYSGFDINSIYLFCHIRLDDSIRDFSVWALRLWLCFAGGLLSV